MRIQSVIMASVVLSCIISADRNNAGLIVICDNDVGKDLAFAQQAEAIPVPGAIVPSSAIELAEFKEQYVATDEPEEALLVVSKVTLPEEPVVDVFQDQVKVADLNHKRRRYTV